MSAQKNDLQLQRLIDAQAAVLGSMLIDSDCIADVLAKVNARMFVSGAYRAVYGAIRELFQAARPVDIVTVGAQLRDASGTSEYDKLLVRLTEMTPSSANVMAYVDVLRQDSIVYRLREIGRALTETEDLQAVLQSQWHPACHGYSMTEREDAETPPDPSVTSPIFFGFSEETTLVCEVCGLPATTTHPLESFSTCDVQRSLEELREGKEPELAPKETTAHASCRRAMLRQLQETIKTWKRALEKWSLLPADK